MVPAMRTYKGQGRFFKLMDMAADLEIEAARAMDVGEADNLRAAAVRVRNAAKLVGEGKA
jgi:hypothetical protein